MHTGDLNTNTGDWETPLDVPSGSLVRAFQTTSVSQFTPLFFSSSSSALRGLWLSFTRTLTEGCFSLSPHLVYVFTTAHSHSPLNDSPSTVSTHRSEIRVRGRQTLAFPFEQGGFTGLQTTGMLRFFCFVLIMAGYYRKGVLPSEGASGMRPALRSAPAAAHSRAMLAWRNKPDAMDSQFQHRSQHREHSICSTNSFNTCDAIILET